MKRFFVFAALAAFALTSCEQKIDIPAEIPTPGSSESTGLVFTATTESAATKTALSPDGENFNVVWQNGDQITIVDGATTPNVGVYSTESTTTTATFTLQSGNAAAEQPFKAWYPASIYNNGAPALPATQDYAEGNISGAPMMAVSSTTSLGFKNLVGIIKLSLTTNQSGQKVSSIALSANEGMSGPFTVTNDAAVVSGTAGVTLNCGTEGVAIGSTAIPFYIAVPANTYTGLSITVTTTAGTSQTFTLKADKTVVVARSEITSINLSANNIHSAYDLTPGDVTVQAGEVATVTGSNANSVLTIKAGASVTLADATLKQILIQGDATLTLSGTNKEETEFNGAAIYISDNATLTITGTGSLAVDRKFSWDYGCICGRNANLVVNGGNMVLESNKKNGGNYVCPAIYVKNYTQNGGSVEAYGKNTSTTEGAYQRGLDAADDVTITGGTLYARGSVGIMAGRNITISGGTVNAIGYYAEYNGSTGIVPGTDRSGKLMITGGTVHAEGNGGEGGKGPGIGRRSAACGDIIISGGDVTVSSTGGAAAIGAGSMATTVDCNITITSGITRLVVTKGASAQAHIGRGNASSSVGTITIDGINNPTAVPLLPNLDVAVSNDGNTLTFTPRSTPREMVGTLSELKGLINDVYGCQLYLGRYVYSNGTIGTVATNAVGRIAHVSSNASSDAGSVAGSRILVLALTDLATNVDVAGADAAILGTPVIAGADQTAWKIPTRWEWVDMGKSLGAGNFQTLIDAVGMDTSTHYWTSTSSNGGYGRYYVHYADGDIYTFDNVSNWYFNYSTPLGNNPHPTLRACFAY